MIVAYGKNREIGKDNTLIWHIKEDLQNFKNITMGKKIVMGANTYKSLPKKLEGRSYIILSKSLKDIEGALIFNDFEKLLSYINSLNEEVVVIGGSSIYQLFLPYADKLYVTEIDDTYDADAYFPEFDKDKYKKTCLKEGKDNETIYRFVLYERLG